MNPIVYTVTNNGFLLTVNGISYVLEWVGSMLKVTGPDVCYYLVQTGRGLEQADCHLKTFSLLMTGVPN